MRNKTTKKLLPTQKEIAEQKEKEQWNANALTHLQHIAIVPKPKLDNAVSVVNSCDKYLLICEQDNVKPTISGLALVLGVSRRTLLDILNGNIKAPNRELIEKYFNAIEVFDEMAMKDGKTPPIVAIFNAKNNYGYTDEQKISLGQQEISNEEIEKRYRDMHEIVNGDDIISDN